MRALPIWKVIQAANLLAKDKARRIAANIAKLPEPPSDVGTEMIQNAMTNSIDGLREGRESCPLRTCPKTIPSRCGTWKPEGPHWRAGPPVFP